MDSPHEIIAQANQKLAMPALWLLLAGFGGAVKYLSTVLRSSDTVSHRRFVLLLSANIFISAFCGLMGALLVSTITDDKTWHGLAAGMFGYIGTQGLDIVLLALKKKINVTPIRVSSVVPVPPSVEE